MTGKPDFVVVGTVLAAAWGTAVAADPTAKDAPSGEAPSGVYRAEPVKDSPVLTVAGMVWWKDRLILADRIGKRLVSFTPPVKFETFKESLHPVGVAVDPQGRLIVSQKEKDVVSRIVRINADGTEEMLADGTDAGSPHFLAVHRNGTIFWSGFPDGGTRCLRPGGNPEKLSTRIGHTFGIALSPAQDKLYVASKLPDAARRGVWRIPLDANGAAGEGEFFLSVQALEPKLEGLPEPKDGKPTLLGWVGRLQGLAVDRLGHLYIAGAESHTSGEAVAVISPDGKRVVAMILNVPHNIAGLAFGGADGRTLFISGAGGYRLHQVRLPAGGR